MRPQRQDSTTTSVDSFSPVYCALYKLNIMNRKIETPLPEFLQCLCFDSSLIVYIMTTA